ncbi:TPR [Branchiostoma lanceolatum]|uniref:Nucleoprotein TPR n=1 Tax=Branchiostoma lanceolatum TaxID=7740 RepID=A0A8J9ZKD6_BRALA|nr:TPR [Branchiostoma lanceolatum]
MATPGCLQRVLDENELSALPQAVVDKLEGHLKNYDVSMDSMQAECQQIKSSLEEKTQLLETEVSTSLDVQQQLHDLEEKHNEVEKQLKQFKDSAGEHETKQNQLERTIKSLEEEKQEMHRMVEKKSSEIDRLNDEWKSMSEQLREANSTRLEAKVKLDQIESQELTIKYKEKRLEQEKELLTNQNQWLNAELEKKTQEILNLRKEKSTEILSLKTQLDSKTEEASHLLGTVEGLKKTTTEQTSRIETLIQKLKDSHDAQSIADEQFRNELHSQKKLASLYQSAAEEAETKASELTTAVQELQKLLKQATSTQEEVEEKLAKTEDELRKRVTESDEKISSLEEELKNANDLLMVARKRGAVSMSDSEVGSTFPVAAATSSMLTSGMTLTEIYNEYVKATDQLELEKMESARLKGYLDQILEEIEQKAPVLQRQREDYERSLQTINKLSQKLDTTALECEQLRAEVDDSRRRTSQLTRENERLSTRTVDLSQQVRVLLKEVEEARGGHVASGEAEVSSSVDVATSSQVISQKLVTFRGIEELQERNEQLLTLMREMSAEHERAEKETTDSRIHELERQLEMSLQDVEALREARDKQQTMVESLVQQRDMYRVLLAQQTAAPSPMALTPGVRQVTSTPMPGAAEPRTPGIQGVLLEDETQTQAALKQLKSEYDTYRKEKAENDRMLQEQLEKLRTEVSDFRTKNARLSSQLEFSVERCKVSQANMESYKKEVASLNERNKKYSNDVVKQQGIINTLTQDQMATKERLAQLEVQKKNLAVERDMLKTAEAQLSRENESLRREQKSQTILSTNLQMIQNNLERADFENKTRYQTQIENLERELGAVRRKLEDESEHHKKVVKGWETRLEELQSQLTRSEGAHNSTREELRKANDFVQELKQQCSTLEGKLASTEMRLTQSQRQADPEGTSPMDTSSSLTDETKVLKNQLQLKEKEIAGLKEQVSLGKQHVEQYKNMATAMEKNLSEQNQASRQLQERLETRLKEATQTRETLEKQIQQLEKEKQAAGKELSEIRDSQGKHTADLRKSLSSLQTEVRDALQKAEDADRKEQEARNDLEQQVKLASEAQDKYERELMLHAADVQALSAVKEQLEDHNDKLSAAQEEARKAQEELRLGKVSREEQKRIQEQSMTTLQSRCQELEKQNNLLHEQIEKLSNQMLSLQARPSRETSVTAASVSEEGKSSEQLLEIIHFIRREKDIAETRFEVTQAESVRYQQRLEQLERQLTEAQQALGDERSRTEAAAQTALQHQELLKKVETLNVLTDSNKLLREEKERVEGQLQEVTAKVQQLQKDIEPLQENNRKLSTMNGSLQAENTMLKKDVDRWTARTRQLIEQSNKADPEEIKRLTEERDNLQKQMSSNTEQMHKFRAEASRLNTQLSAEKNKTSEASRESMRLKTDVNQLKAQNSSLQGEMAGYKSFNTKQAQEIESLKKEVQAKSAEVEEKLKSVTVLKKIGRRYKSQFEEKNTECEALSKEMETVKKENEELKTKVAQAPAQGAAAEAATPQQQAQLEEKTKAVEEMQQQLKTFEDQVTKLRQEAAEVEEKLKKAEEEKTALQASETNLTKSLTDEKEKAKKVLFAAKQKIQQLTNQRDTRDKEVSELKDKSAAAEQSKEELELRLSSLKSQYEGKIMRLERQLSDVQEQNRHELDRQQQEQQDLQKRVEEQQRQLEARQKQLQVQQQHQVQQMMPSNEPPTANIRPMATPSTSTPTSKVHTVPPVMSGASSSHGSTHGSTHGSNKPTPRASIRPIAKAPATVSVTPTSSGSMTPTATVMPTTQADTQEVVTVAPVSGVVTVTNTMAVVQATSTQQATAFVQPTQQHSVVQAEVQDIQPSATVSPTPVDRTPTPVEQTATPPHPYEPQPGPSSAPEPSQDDAAPSGKRQREMSTPDVQGGDAHPVTKRAKTEAPTEEPTEVTEADQGLGEEESAEEPPAGTAGTAAMSQPAEDSDDDVIVVDDDDDEEEVDDEDEEEEYEEGDSVDEEDYEDDVEEEGSEGEEEMEEEQEEEEEETYEMGEEGESGEEMQEEDAEEEEEEEEELGDEEQGSDEDVVEIVDDDDEPAMQGRDQLRSEAAQPMSTDQDNQQSRQQPQEEQSRPVIQSRPRQPVPTLTVQPPPTDQSQPQPIQPQRIPPRLEPRLLPTGRAQLAPFSLGPGHGGPAFEDVDDCTVPSTPTLFVPRRTDGFAEALNSPQIQGVRFSFGPPSEIAEMQRAQPGLAQLATQGALGMDDTHMDLLGGEDEGSGRSVPTTPVHLTAPVTVFSEGGPSVLEHVEMSTVQSIPRVPSPRTSPRAVPVSEPPSEQASQDVPQSSGDSQTGLEDPSLEEEEVEGREGDEEIEEPEDEGKEATTSGGDASTEEQAGEFEAGGQVQASSSGAGPTSAGATGSTESRPKPNIKPVVWSESSTSTSQPPAQHHPPQRGRPNRRIRVRGAAGSRRGFRGSRGGGPPRQQPF